MRFPRLFRSTWNKMLRSAERWTGRVARAERDVAERRARVAEAQLRSYDLIVVEHTIARAALRVENAELRARVARFEELVGA